MNKIPAENQIVQIAIVPGIFITLDAEDVDRVAQQKWWQTVRVNGDENFYTYRNLAGIRQTISLGRFILNLECDYACFREPNIRRDYRKANLLIKTHSERQKGLKKKRTATTSKYKGVSFIRSRNKWYAQIEVNGRCINLGRYEAEKGAARAYNEAAKKFFGELALLNDITDSSEENAKAVSGE